MRLLVLSDDPTSCAIIAQSAADLGLTPRVIADPAVAIDAQRQSPAPLVIVDWERATPAVCAELRRLHPSNDLYLLFLVNAEDVAAALPLVDGSGDYLLKPLDRARVSLRLRMAERWLASAAQHREMAAELGQEQRFMHAVLDTMGSLLCVLDRDARIVVFNRACQRLTGWSFEEVAGRRFYEFLLTDEEREPVRSVFERLAAGHFPSTYENYWVTRDGRRRRIVWTNTALTENGAVTHVVSGGIDVTEERALAERVRHADRLAALGAVTTALAHEVRNPLNAAHLQLLLVERRLQSLNGEGSGAAQAARLVRAELVRLQQLVQDVLAFARPARPQLDAADLRRTVSDIGALLGPDLADAGVRLELRLPAEPVDARFDDARMKQVLINLVRNAAEAAGHGGTVAIDARRRGGVVELVVEDTGPGLPDGLDPFEPFSTTKPAGTGLGLPTAQKIIADHGGSLRYARKNGRTAFTVLLPPDGESAAAAAPAAPTATATAST